MENEHMDSLDNFRERVEALEQRTEQLIHHTRTVERRLRLWRGMACGVVMLGLFSLMLPSGKAADAPGRGMAERMATLEQKLAAMAYDPAANEVVITGANLRIVNGLGNTETMNGLGNLIVGYNEVRPPESGLLNNRTGSHNVVIGEWNNFSSFGGLVVGFYNEVSGIFASVSGGSQNIASGRLASVSGGLFNRVSGSFASVSGGNDNTASGGTSSVSGGIGNMASGDFASSVSGGRINVASGEDSAVSGGQQNTASGFAASVSGGFENIASGELSSVSGGRNRNTPGEFNWAAGALFSDQ
jgi:hypothetical protein